MSSRGGLRERPRERLLHAGSGTLSPSELVALVLRTGLPGCPATQLADELMRRFGTLEGISQAGEAELRSVPGMGPAKIASLRAAFELGSRVARAPLVPGQKPRGPRTRVSG